MSLVAYVAEDDLVGHQWEERPLVLRRSFAPVQGNARAKKWEWQNDRVADSAPVLTVKPDQPDFRLGEGGGYKKDFAEGTLL